MNEQPTDSAERTAFEAWAESRFGPLARDLKLDYVYTDVRAAWRAWQARAAHSPAEVPAEPVAKNDEELLMRSLTALEYYQQQTRPISAAIEVMDMLRERIGSNRHRTNKCEVRVLSVIDGRIEVEWRVVPQGGTPTKWQKQILELGDTFVMRHNFQI